MSFDYKKAIELSLFGKDTSIHYFYIIEGYDYLGFGITKNPHSRNSDYTLFGKVIPFVYLYRGTKSDINSLEHQYKRGLYPLVQIKEKNREWFADEANLDLNTFKKMVDKQISDWDSEIVLCAKDYRYTECPGLEYLKEAVLNEK